MVASRSFQVEFQDSAIMLMDFSFRQFLQPWGWGSNSLERGLSFSLFFLFVQSAVDIVSQFVFFSDSLSIPFFSYLGFNSFPNIQFLFSPCPDSRLHLGPVFFFFIFVYIYFFGFFSFLISHLVGTADCISSKWATSKSTLVQLNKS